MKKAASSAEYLSSHKSALPERPIVVITGDVVNSTKLAQTERINMLPTLEKALAEARTLCPDWVGTIFQGDSFQGYTLENRPSALAAALHIWCQMRSQEYTIRLAIGLGGVALSTGSTLTSDGEGFRQSGRLLQKMKETHWLLGVSSLNTNFTQEWYVHALAATFLMQRCTALQAEALVCQLKGFTQQQTAIQLGIKQPAVHQRLQSAGWPVLEAMIHRFAEQIN